MTDQHQDLRLELRELVGQAAIVLELRGLPLPPALKRRDAREPGRRRKEDAEAALSNLILRYWADQRRALREYLEPRLAIAESMRGKSTLGSVEWLLEDLTPEWWRTAGGNPANDFMRAFSSAVVDGVSLFGENAAIGLDYTAVNTQAAEYASTYVTDWMTSLDSATADALRAALNRFVLTPGATLRDVMDMIPFNEQRSMTIAVTETTRAYAEGNQIAANEMARQFPDVEVTKMWFTNNDDRVCEVCGALEGQEVPFNGEWEVAGMRVKNPPAHVNCRCWADSSTRLGNA